MFGIALTTALALASAGPAAGGSEPLFRAAWRGFDTGSFEEAFGPASLAVGDLDGDGDLDVLVGQAHFGTPGVSVMLSDADGTFGAPAHHPLLFDEVVGRVALSDFDADGDLDAALASGLVTEADVDAALAAIEAGTISDLLE